MRIVTLLLIVLVLLGIAAGGSYVYAGRAAGPVIDIGKPDGLMGTSSTLDFTVDAPGGKVTAIEVTFDQGTTHVPLFSLPGSADAAIRQESPTMLRVTRPIGRQNVPGLVSGPARISVRATRPVFFGLRTASSTAGRDVTVRLEPPRVTVLSTHHYVNLGGSEMVVYRATPPDVQSGVRVGEAVYPGFPAQGADAKLADPALHVAFFALLYDQDVSAPVEVFAEDGAGNHATGSLPDYKPFPRPFKRSRIELDDAFLNRAVSEILQNSPEFAATVPDQQDRLAAFLKINGSLRQQNAEELAAMTHETSPKILWQGAFQQLGNSKVESSFADHRTYFYKGTEVDQQVHLGFDLAVTAATPIAASNAGTVVHAAYLGIYGNAVVIDHGMGLQSLYGHLSSIDVKKGDAVQKGQIIGRSGMTGLAGGDHLHLTLLLNGHPVSPVDWWDPHWIEDRVTRKLREAGGGPPAASAAPAPAPARRRRAHR